MTVPYVYVEAARFIAACGAVGSILGLAIGLVKEQRRAP